MLKSSFVHPRLLDALVRPGDVVAFWRAAGPQAWFARNPAFGMRFRGLFADAFALAEAGALDAWEETAEGALALVILLDQYPRNAFRGTARMYATDPQGRAVADRALKRGFDAGIEPDLRLFFYLPLAHSERPADQDRSVALCARLGEPSASRARHHRDIVARFGRFPHRNAILGRVSTTEELDWLAAGGFAG
jgi:uncharacterized protein (DUF924 family)